MDFNALASAKYDELMLAWRAGELQIPTFGDAALERHGYMRDRFEREALTVAAGLIARGLRGAAASDWIEASPHLKGTIEGRAALAVISQASPKLYDA